MNTIKLRLIVRNRSEWGHGQQYLFTQGIFWRGNEDPKFYYPAELTFPVGLDIWTNNIFSWCPYDEETNMRLREKGHVHQQTRCYSFSQLLRADKLQRILKYKKNDPRIS